MEADSKQIGCRAQIISAIVGTVSVLDHILPKMRKVRGTVTKTAQKRPKNTQERESTCQSRR